MKRSSKAILFITAAIITCSGLHRFVGQKRFGACGHRCHNKETTGSRLPKNSTPIHIN